MLVDLIGFDAAGGEGAALVLDEPVLTPEEVLPSPSAAADFSGWDMLCVVVLGELWILLAGGLVV